MKILVIDDNAHHAELASRRLMREGWEVLTTDEINPKEDFNQYDFILLDYSMPHRNGLEILKLMRDHDVRTPVIFLTGHGNEMIATEAIKHGAYDYVMKDTKLVYLDRLPSVIREAKSKHELIETNRFLIQELRKANERLQKMTLTDELTRIYNFRFIRNQLDIEIQRAIRYSKPLSLCLIDVDHFKQINDRFGHPTGDVVLKEIAQMLTQGIRSVDFVGRYGGDEFVIIFPDTELRDALRLLERIRKQIASHTFKAHGRTIRSSLSFGLTDLNRKNRPTAESLVQRADRCLYQAKRRGRNRVISTARPPKRGSSKGATLSV